MQDGDKRKGYILKPLDEAFANTTVEEWAAVEFSTFHGKTLRYA
jgi:hypothetical protein